MDVTGYTPPGEGGGKRKDVRAAERMRRYRARKRAREQAAAKAARGYSWPPFERGNVAAMTSGYTSGRVLESRAAEIAAEVLGDPAVAYLSAPGYAPSVRLWAFSQVKAELFIEYLAYLPVTEQMTPPKRGSIPPIEIARRLIETALRAADRLGLTPLSRARMGRDVAGVRFDLARLWAAEDGADDLPEGAV